MWSSLSGAGRFTSRAGSGTFDIEKKKFAFIWSFVPSLMLKLNGS